LITAAGGAVDESSREKDRPLSIAIPIVSKKGPGRRTRPVSSRTTTRSRKLPKPPYSSGMPSAVQPCSATFFQRFAS